MTSNKFMTLDSSWSYPCVCLTGAQFWRSSQKILMAKKSEMANLNKGKGKIKKAKRKTTSWTPALFHHFPSDLSRQVSAGILRKNKLLKY